jgi:hypothetical protein
MITVVTGIPRSGTSLMMQMLQAGGMQLLIDEHRRADASNPKGYFEFELVKHISKNSFWINNAEGKAVKIIIPHLFHVPLMHDYKILFMERKIEQIIKSQTIMLNRKNNNVTELENQKLATIFKKQLIVAKKWIKTQHRMRTLYISYNGLIEDRGFIVDKIIKFLEITLDKQGMLNTIDKNLYRQRI